MRLAHLDVEAVCAHIGDLEAVDAGAGALARFHLQQIAVGVGGEAPQLVERGIEAGAEDAAVACEQGQGVCERLPQACGEGAVAAELLAKGLQAAGFDRAECGLHQRQRQQRIAQAGEIARARAAQRDAASNAFQIGDVLQRGAQGLDARRPSPARGRGDCCEQFFESIEPCVDGSTIP